MSLTDKEIEEKTKEAQAALKADGFYIRNVPYDLHHILEKPILDLSAAILVLAQVEAGKLAIVNGMDDIRESFREAKLLILGKDDVGTEKI